jgi:hypothetical protein
LQTVWNFCLPNAENPEQSLIFQEGARFLTAKRRAIMSRAISKTKQQNKESKR